MAYCEPCDEMVEPVHPADARRERCPVCQTELKDKGVKETEL